MLLTPRTRDAARPRHNRYFLTLALLAAPASVAAQAPDVIRVPGIVRDFRAAHDDFGLSSSDADHFAGNVATTLGAEGRPVFSGAGFRVAQQWTNKTAQPIAPHMYRGSSPGVVLVAYPSGPPSHGVLDSWDSTQGPYGGTNVGPAPEFVAAPMPVINVPINLPPHVDEVTYNRDTTLVQDLNCDELTIRKTLTIEGQRVIYVEEEFHMHTHAAIELAPGASLDLYINELASTWNHVELNVNTGDPSRVRIYNLGTDALVLHNHADVYARVFSPNADVELSNHGALFGTFHGRRVEFLSNGDFHVDTPVVLDVCGDVFNDRFGAAGTGGSGSITSSASFAQWYKDLLGTNLSTLHMLELTRNDSGIYEAVFDDFHPIDGMLFGNEGAAHNDLFTYSFSADFVYDACQAQFLEFEGADDCWVFVNDQLVIDLGGIMPGTSQVAEMDRLGLTDGETCKVRLFYAQRQSTSSEFNLRTNIELQPPIYKVAGTGGFD